MCSVLFQRDTTEPGEDTESTELIANPAAPFVAVEASKEAESPDYPENLSIPSELR